MLNRNSTVSNRDSLGTTPLKNSAGGPTITVTYGTKRLNLIRIKEKQDGKNSSAYDGAYVLLEAYEAFEEKHTKSQEEYLSSKQQYETIALKYEALKDQREKLHTQCAATRQHLRSMDQSNGEWARANNFLSATEKALEVANQELVDTEQTYIACKAQYQSLKRKYETLENQCSPDAYPKEALYFLKMFPKQKEMWVEGFCEALLGKIIAQMIEKELIPKEYKECFSPAEAVVIPQVGLGLLQPFLQGAKSLFNVANENQDKKDWKTETLNRYQGVGYTLYFNGLVGQSHGMAYILMIMIMFGNYSFHSGNILVTEKIKSQININIFTIIDYGAAFRYFFGSYGQQDIWQSLEELRPEMGFYEHKKYLDFYKGIPGLFDKAIQHAKAFRLTLLDNSPAKKKYDSERRAEAKTKQKIFESIIKTAIVSTYSTVNSYISQVKPKLAKKFITSLRKHLGVEALKKTTSDLNSSDVEKFAEAITPEITTVVYARIMKLSEANPPPLVQPLFRGEDPDEYNSVILSPSNSVTGMTMGVRNALLGAFSSTMVSPITSPRTSLRLPPKNLPRACYTLTAIRYDGNANLSYVDIQQLADEICPNPEQNGPDILFFWLPRAPDSWLLRESMAARIIKRYAKNYDISTRQGSGNPEDERYQILESKTGRFSRPPFFIAYKKSSFLYENEEIAIKEPNFESSRKHTHIPNSSLCAVLEIRGARLGIINTPLETAQAEEVGFYHQLDNLILIESSIGSALPHIDIKNVKPPLLRIQAEGQMSSILSGAVGIKKFTCLLPLSASEVSIFNGYLSGVCQSINRGSDVNALQEIHTRLTRPDCYEFLLLYFKHAIETPALNTDNIIYHFSNINIIKEDIGFIIDQLHVLPEAEFGFYNRLLFETCAAIENATDLNKGAFMLEKFEQLLSEQNKVSNYIRIKLLRPFREWLDAHNITRTPYSYDKHHLDENGQVIINRAALTYYNNKSGPDFFHQNWEIASPNDLDNGSVMRELFGHP